MERKDFLVNKPIPGTTYTYGDSEAHSLLYGRTPNARHPASEILESGDWIIKLAERIKTQRRELGMHPRKKE